MMPLALSTRWNAGRHHSGEALIEEILELGLDHVELGYDLRAELIPGIHAMVDAKAIRIDSVHNFCPVPVGAPRPHPELYTPASTDRREREYAVTHISRTLRFAAEVGARVAVCHSGNVDMPSYSFDLLRMAAHNEQFTPPFEALKLKAQILRDKKAPRQIEYLYETLEALLPVVQETGVQLALENLPTWEAIPSELEGEKIMQRFHAHGIRLWWDIGHAQIRENLGFINASRWLRRLLPYIAGMHIHDVAPPGQDHLMPPLGKVDFPALADVGRMDKVCVLEPAPDTDPAQIVRAVDYLRDTWNLAEPT
ncbi:MAG: sugar phosphate isomerase/epimerase family protein [Kiritimatiellia bacterium]|jgi:sugar phosphate isomerase/epimerase|nr:sugar phosphate isomerase/epimerase family protein [Kiritimatiellia bacterium]